MNQNHENEVKVVSKEELLDLPSSIQEWVTQQKMQSGLHKMQVENTEYTLISLGMRPNPGYELQVTNIVQQGNQAKVEVLEQEPVPGMFYPQIIVYPFILTESAVPVDVQGLSDENRPDSENPQSK